MWVRGLVCAMWGRGLDGWTRPVPLGTVEGVRWWIEQSTALSIPLEDLPMLRHIPTLVLPLLFPVTGLAQTDPVDGVPDQATVSFLLVLVEDPGFDGAPAVLRIFPDEPLSRLGTTVLVRSAGASPWTIAAAAGAALLIEDRGLYTEGSDLAVPVPVDRGGQKPPEWAVTALAQLRSAQPVSLWEFGEARTLSLGVSAEMIRRHFQASEELPEDGGVKPPDG